MTREEALRLADLMVTGWINDPPKNARGYSDGWKPPTIAERTEAVERLATFLLGSNTTLAAPLPPEELPHLHRASCHGAIGELLCGFPPGPTI